MADLLRIVVLILAVTFSGCYHMRAEPVQIKARALTVKGTPAEVLPKLHRLLETEWGRRVLQQEESGSRLLITAPYHFATDTGFGQPAGGRKYYMQLYIELEPQGAQTRLTIRPYNYEIRSTYAYGLDGQVRTLYKHYPYEQYPGMFDLKPLNEELDMVSLVLGQKLKE